MRNRVRGLTLVELLMAMTLIGVVIAIGMPAFGELVSKRRIEQHSRALLGAINLARAEAIVRASSVTICPSQMARTGVATCAGVYADGWIVFANANRSANFEPAEDEMLRVYAALPSGYSVVNRTGTAPIGGRINYLADGSAHRPMTLQLCSPGTNDAPLSVVLNIVGRARLEKQWGRCVVPV